jgi:DnaJ-class molecular chaperone
MKARKRKQCDSCKGKGYFSGHDGWGWGKFPTKTECKKCKGLGFKL